MEPLQADYFDGRRPRAHAVRVHWRDGGLRIEGDDVSRDVPLREVARWPERTAHGPRIVHLADGASLVVADSAAWDAWRRAGGAREPAVVRLQQSWRGTAASLVAAVLAIAAVFLWVVPWGASVALAALPPSVDRSIGEKALATLDMHWTQPSALPASQQAQLRDAWSRALQSLPEDERLPHALVFRKSRVGANAFALPGGTIVMTDELVRRVGGDEAILVGVLGHELGHLRHRHGMRMLIQASALGAVVGVLVGDVSSLLASVPAWLGQASYSRQAEREADAEALGLLRAAGVSPLVMVTFFETMGAAAGAERASGEVPAVLSTHPPDAERIAFFRAAAQGR